MSRAGGWILACGLVLFAFTSIAQEETPVVEITPGKERAFRVAVQRFSDRAPPLNPRRADDLRQAIEEGLRFSGVFEPIPTEAFLGEENTTSLQEGRRYDCADWTQSGADALVEGQISREGSQLVVEFAVWDTARCLRLGRRILRRATSQGRALARLVADHVVEAFTGTRGASATEIAYISTRPRGDEVFVINADGSDARPGTNSGTIKAFPDWLPDGGGILYTAYHNGSQPALYLTSRGTARPGPVLEKLMPKLPKYRGVFHPEGKYLAFVTSIEGSAQIFTVRRDGRRLRRLTHSGAIDVSPSWSPDGKQLVFVSDRSGSPQLYVIDRKGTNLRRLTYQGSYNTSPAWSPDGRWIVYETRLEAQFDIWLIDPAGEVNFPLVVHPRNDESPSWSPDGRKLVFSSNRRGLDDIYTMDLSGDNLQRLTTGENRDRSPTWGPFPR